MFVYVDSSVLLRVILGQQGRLSGWDTIESGVASALVEVECLRTLDRLQLNQTASPEELASRREAVFRLCDKLHIMEPSMLVLRRASQPLPILLGTLDAIHLATALLWQEARGDDLVMATHDHALAVAARASGLAVIGE